jgi:hypothetical protein
MGVVALRVSAAIDPFGVLSAVVTPEAHYNEGRVGRIEMSMLSLAGRCISNVTEIVGCSHRELVNGGVEEFDIVDR